MKIKNLILSVIAGALLFSCASTNDVVGGGIIQKRKYNDGYYVSLNKKFNKKNVENESINENTVSTDNEKIEYSNVENESNVETQNSSELVIANEEISVQTETQPIADNTLSLPEIKKEAELADKQNESEEINKRNAKVYLPKKVETITKGSNASSDVMLIVCVILCFIIPPLAVFLFEGASGRFWIDLILFIIGIAIVGWLLIGISGLALLASVIYALLIVLSVI